MKISASVVAIGGALAMVAAKPSLADAYVYTTIASPGATRTAASGLNDLDQVVGIAYADPKRQTGFVWTAGSFASFDAAPANPDGRTSLQAIDDRGEAAGTYISVHEAGPVIVSAGTLRKPDFGTVTNVGVAGINKDGVIVGSADFAGVRKAFTYKAGVLTPLDPFLGTFEYTYGRGINGRGDVVGYVLPGNLYGGRGFIRRADGTVTKVSIPASRGTDLTFIDDTRLTAGYYYGQDFHAHGIVRAPNGSIQQYDFPGSTYTIVVAVGAGGQVVGDYVGAGGNFRAFTYGAGVYRDVTPPGASDGFIAGLNAKSSIAGTYIQGGVTFGFLAACPGAPGSCSH